MTTTTQAIPDRSSPGSTRAAPAASNQGRGGKLTTGNQTGMRIPDNTVIGTWNVRTLSATGKLHELVHELKRYQWQMLLLLFATTRSVFKSVKVSVVEIAKRTN